MEENSFIYNSDEEFLEVLLNAYKTQSNICLKFEEIKFLFHPMGEKINIYINDSELVFNSFNDFVDNFKIDGKTFKVLLPDIDFG